MDSAPFFSEHICSWFLVSKFSVLWLRALDSAGYQSVFERAYINVLYRIVKLLSILLSPVLACSGITTEVEVRICKKFGKYVAYGIWITISSGYSL